MVLESILNPSNAEDKPLHVFIITLVYVLIAILFSNQLFPSQASILTIALITIIFVPFFQKLFEIEENKEDLAAENKTSENLFARHKKIIFVFSAFFLGIIIAMSFVFIFFPQENIFSLQSDTLRSFSAAATLEGDFMRFFLNNTEVMVLMFILSAMFGAGAIFVLAWNASVIAVYVGLIIKSLIGKGIEAGAAYLYGVPVGLGTIALHGIPEISAYFVAGLAGGILSVGIIREEVMSKEFKKIFKDSIILLIFAELLIIGAAFIEAAF
jgi:uncharacterized membrane protein SpoIIM required for sporulation